MLQIYLPKSKYFNEATEEFVFFEPVTLKLEHSLISLHKWEAKWHKSYLSSKDFTAEEQLDYIRCMSIDPNVTTETLMRLTRKDYQLIYDYIHNPMTATTFSKQTENQRKKQIVTAEIIYYWMVSFGIPFECSKWHLNQLLTLITVCSIKNAPQKKGKNSKDIARQNMNLNKLRRARMGTTG